jgi:hypothetical protein
MIISVPWRKNGERHNSPFYYFYYRIHPRHATKKEKQYTSHVGRIGPFIVGIVVGNGW